MNYLNSLTTNITSSVIFLQNDLLWKLDLSILIVFIKSMLISIFFIFLFYLAGKKIYIFLNKTAEVKTYSYLIYIALGYIFLSSIIALIGMLGNFNKNSLLTILLFITLFCIKNIKNTYKDIKKLIIFIKQDILYLKKYFFVYIFTSLFILIAIINLFNPEIREDQYHVDLPKYFLNQNSIMIFPKEDIKVSASPLLPEMTYTMGIILDSKESARYIHFSFYILVILILINYSKINKYKFTIFSPLLFASAPVVIKETSSMYTDFQWIFCLLLGILILTDDWKDKILKLKLSGILIGGMISGKLWTIAILPIISLFVATYFRRKIYIKNLIIFLLFTLLVSGIWFLRSFLLTGNPIFPAFMNSNDIRGINHSFTIFDYISINKAFINPNYFYNVFSPLFFIGIIFLMINYKKINTLIKEDKLFIFTILIFITYLFIQYPFGRYLLGLYIFLILYSSYGMFIYFQNNKYIRLTIYFLSLSIFIYYFVNAMLILPYSFNIADKNKYLSRILIRDNSSYFDFNYKFNNFINENDLVAMYNIHGYYYADFNFIDINYIFNHNNRNFDELKNKKITKIFIRGGDILWFCKETKIQNCNTNKYQLISSYLQHPTYYLYLIK